MDSGVVEAVTESQCEALHGLVCQLQHAVCVAGSLGAMQGVCIDYDKEQLEEYAKAYLEYTQSEAQAEAQSEAHREEEEVEEQAQREVEEQVEVD